MTLWLGKQGILTKPLFSYILLGYLETDEFFLFILSINTINFFFVSPLLFEGFLFYMHDILIAIKIFIWFISCKTFKWSMMGQQEKWALSMTVNSKNRVPMTSLLDPVTTSLCDLQRRRKCLWLYMVELEQSCQGPTWMYRCLHL